MADVAIGRVLVASLHQAIADVLPTRLSFYENWLNAEGLREGTIGLAPLYAVLSFLRQEGTAYEQITRRAGEYAADWTVESMTPLQRKVIRATPWWLRGRLLMRVAGQLVRSSYQGSQATARVRRSTARIQVRASVFCTVREPVQQPLCGFYAAAFTRLLTLFDSPARISVIACRGKGEANCVMTMALVDGIRDDQFIVGAVL